VKIKYVGRAAPIATSLKSALRQSDGVARVGLNEQHKKRKVEWERKEIPEDGVEKVVEKGEKGNKSGG